MRHRIMVDDLILCVMMDRLIACIVMDRAGLDAFDMLNIKCKKALRVATLRAFVCRMETHHIS